MRPEDRRALLIGLVSYVLFFGFAYLMSVPWGYGEAESRHDPDSLWMYARRLGMVAMAAGLPLLTGHEGLRSYGYRLTPRWALITVVVGVFVAYGNRGGYTPTSVAFVLGAGWHTFATELYHRAYWISLLSRIMPGSKWGPIMVAAVLYGLSYFSVWATWNNDTLPPWGFFFLFTFIGTLFGWGYKTSGSLLVAWGMHWVGVLDFKVFLR